MPLTLLDIGLLVVMLISGILAMVRGFMREILSIAAWLIAADRKSTRLNSSHSRASRMPSSA